MVTIKAQPVNSPSPGPISFLPLGSVYHAPLTNAERQQRWRDKHRGRSKRAAVTGPPPGSRPRSGPALAVPAPAPAVAADAAVVLRAATGGSRGKVRDVFDAHVRPLSAAGRLQLMRMIVDSLAAAG